LSRLAAAFGRIASSIEERQPEGAVGKALHTTQVLCTAAASGAPSTEIKALLTNVQRALETWRTVWPRLGGQREFRQAVAREANLWARKLSELVTDAK